MNSAENGLVADPQGGPGRLNDPHRSRRNEAGDGRALDQKRQKRCDDRDGRCLREGRAGHFGRSRVPGKLGALAGRLPLDGPTGRRRRHLGLLAAGRLVFLRRRLGQSAGLCGLGHGAEVGVGQDRRQHGQERKDQEEQRSPGSACLCLSTVHCRNIHSRLVGTKRPRSNLDKCILIRAALPLCGRPGYRPSLRLDEVVTFLSPRHSRLRAEPAPNLIAGIQTSPSRDLLRRSHWPFGWYPCRDACPKISRKSSPRLLCSREFARNV